MRRLEIAGPCVGADGPWEITVVELGRGRYPEPIEGTREHVATAHSISEVLDAMQAVERPINVFPMRWLHLLREHREPAARWGA